MLCRKSVSFSFISLHFGWSTNDDEIFTPIFKVYHIEFHERLKMTFTIWNALVPEIFQFQKCAKYANEMTDNIIHSTKYYQVYK